MGSMGFLSTADVSKERGWCLLFFLIINRAFRNIMLLMVHPIEHTVTDVVDVDIIISTNGTSAFDFGGVAGTRVLATRSTLGITRSTAIHTARCGGERGLIRAVVTRRGEHACTSILVCANAIHRTHLRLPTARQPCSSQACSWPR
jgi:hypothetical protein